MLLGFQGMFDPGETGRKGRKEDEGRKVREGRKVKEEEKRGMRI